MKNFTLLMCLLAGNLFAGSATLNLLEHISDWNIKERPQEEVEVRLDENNQIILQNSSADPMSYAFTDEVSIISPVLTLDVEFTSVPLKTSVAGIEIAGIKNEAGQPFRILIYPFDEVMLINGETKAYRPLVEDPYRFELIIKFSEQTASVYLGSQLVGEPSFASRSNGGLRVLAAAGTVKLNGLYCSGMAGADSSGDVTIQLPSKMQPIPSPWISYFGTHCATSAKGAQENFSICRHYGGVWMGIPPDKSKRGGPDGETHIGPFTGKPVKLRIEDFRSQKPTDENRDRTALDVIPEAISNQIDIVYTIKTIVPPEAGDFDKDLLYWTVRLIHERFPAAKDRIYWQLGNELMGGHFDPLHNMEKDPVPPYKSTDGKIRGYAIDWKADYYVNDYFAPAAESIRRAAQDVYGDSDAIRMLIGSVNPYNQENLEFMDLMLKSTIDGRQAPTLDGKKLTDICPNLTVHYMFRSAEQTALLDTMNELAEKQLVPGTLKKIWMTEEHGARGKGPVNMLRTITLFMDWVAGYHLSSDQTKVIWYGDSTVRPGGDIRKWMATLTDFFGSRPLSFYREDTTDALFYFLKAKDRLCVMVIPRQARSLAVNRLILDVPVPVGKVTADAVQFSPVAAPENIPVSPVVQYGQIELMLEHTIADPFLLFLNLN